jgi:uncharacterized membrane protein YqjE
MADANNSTANNSTDQRDRPVGELLRDLSQEATTLVRKEIELAKAELSEKGRKAGAGAGMFGGAAALALAALGALTACFIAALDSAMPLWLAALIVALAYAGVAGVLALRGKRQTEEALPAAPEQTIETVKEDIEWSKTQVGSARR